MRLAGLQKLTLLDYPGKTAATVFTPGCNFRCPFCHNAELVQGAAPAAGSDESEGGNNEETPYGANAQRGADEGRGADAQCPEDDERNAGAECAGSTSESHLSKQPFPTVSEEEFFSFLDKRQGLLDGICITGGEPLLQPDIEAFCAEIKRRGFAVKLDTNGSLPDRLRALVDDGLVDYVAMDAKNSPARYAETIGVPAFDLSSVEASVAYLLSGAVPYEFRTTIVREYHDEMGLTDLARWIKGADAWYLQAFVDSDTVLAGEGSLSGYAPDELEALVAAVRPIVPTARIRGV
ncbi:radical SAM protein [Raoultibacter phocaeensis]|uniref:radical SAM protein n=1 Tax=Raoultibacter phocaeensis TaxID=2479841 RepID=UPI0011187EE0|nr:radical SAM protein [Raoultibacter phocaeensis]